MNWEREEAHKLPIPGNDGRSFGLREENNSRMQTTQAGRSLHVLQALTRAHSETTRTNTERAREEAPPPRSFRTRSKLRGGLGGARLR